MLRNFVITLAFFLFVIFANAQNILIDEGVHAKGLWCFPIHEKPNTYVYLPSDAHLALKENGLPQFSYMRYVLEKPTENQVNTITEADGGGILHFLVVYDTPQAKIEEAETYLRNKFENDSIFVKGPVVFDQGRYTLISAILNSESGKEEQKIIGSGEAPILENSKLALSFSVDPIKSKLLLESFKMATPDVSLLFELGFSGLTDSYQATLDVDWSEVRKSQQLNAGGNLYFLKADVGVSLDNLRRDSAIKLSSVGSDNSMESLVQTAYSKLIEMMYKKVPLEQLPKAEKVGVEKMISSLLKSKGAKGKIPDFSLNVAYKHKEHRTEGKTHMEFKGRSRVNRNHFITFNVGDLYKKYGSNETIFKDVPLWDPAFQQRDIYVGIDGNVEKEFEKMINSITVKVKKQHQDGSETLKEVLVTNASYKSNDGTISITYLNHKDTDRSVWLEYEYQTIWKFIGGATYSSDWKKESAAMINLYVPFERKKIELVGDLSEMKAQNVRAIATNISYDFFGNKNTESRTIYPKDKLENKFFEITLPKGENEINYSLTWFFKEKSKLTKEGVDTYGLLFIDELPKE